MRYPLDAYWVSTNYSGAHPALDIATNNATQGNPIKAPESGVIAAVNNDANAYFGGKYVVLQGDSGYRHYMGHNKTNHVSQGQRVKEGDHIADVGMTGQADGPHIHWEVSRDGKTVDPAAIVIPATKPKEEQFVIEEQRPVFKPSYYLEQNPDVKKAGYTLATAVEHWTKFGINEGRPSAPNFHVKEYLANYGDLRKAYGAKGHAKAVKHYFNNGINESRSGRTLTTSQKLIGQIKSLVSQTTVK